MFYEMSPNTALLEDPEQQVIPSCFSGIIVCSGYKLLRTSCCIMRGRAGEATMCGLMGACQDSGECSRVSRAQRLTRMSCLDEAE